MSSATRMHSLSVTSGPRRGDLFLEWHGCCMHWPDTTVGCRSTTADVYDCISRMSVCNQSACFFFCFVFFRDWNPIIVQNSSLSASSFAADIETLASVTFHSAEIDINRSIYIWCVVVEILKADAALRQIGVKLSSLFGFSRGSVVGIDGCDDGLFVLHRLQINFLLSERESSLLSLLLRMRRRRLKTFPAGFINCRRLVWSCL